MILPKSVVGILPADSSRNAWVKEKKPEAFVLLILGLVIGRFLVKVSDTFQRSWHIAVTDLRAQDHLEYFLSPLEFRPWAMA